MASGTNETAMSELQKDKVTQSMTVVNNTCHEKTLCVSLEMTIEWFKHISNMHNEYHWISLSSYIIYIYT